MKKIVVDAGHGGEDQGASGNGIIEKDLTLKINYYRIINCVEPHSTTAQKRL